MATATSDARPGLGAPTGVVELAIRARSIHNTQPWWWRIDEQSGIGGSRSTPRRPVSEVLGSRPPARPYLFADTVTWWLGM